MLKYIIVLAVFGIIALLGYIRVAPIDAARFHTLPEPRNVGDYEYPQGFTVIREVTASQIDVMGAVNQVALTTPRTKRIAGDIGTALISYETRSAVLGFPDYASVSFIQPGTVGNEGPLLVIESRLRFGVADLDVNKKRIEGWLERLGPLTVTP